MKSVFYVTPACFSSRPGKATVYFATTKENRIKCIPLKSGHGEALLPFIIGPEMINAGRRRRGWLLSTHRGKAFSF